MNTATVAWGLATMSPFELRWQNTAWIFLVPSIKPEPVMRAMPISSIIHREAIVMSTGFWTVS